MKQKNLSSIGKKLKLKQVKSKICNETKCFEP